MILTLSSKSINTELCNIYKSLSDIYDLVGEASARTPALEKKNTLRGYLSAIVSNPLLVAFRLYFFDEPHRENSDTEHYDAIFLYEFNTGTRL